MQQKDGFIMFLKGYCGWTDFLPGVLIYCIKKIKKIYPIFTILIRVLLAKLYTVGGADASGFSWNSWRSAESIV